MYGNRYQYHNPLHEMVMTSFAFGIKSTVINISVCDRVVNQKSMDHPLDVIRQVDCVGYFYRISGLHK